MNNSINMYSVLENSSIQNALKAINENTKVFFVITNAANKVVGVITDGDIRRAFIASATTDNSISDYVVRKCTSLSASNDISDAIELFKNKAPKSLPILNGTGELENILTKIQLLLQDVHEEINYDFTTLDDAIVDHEIFQRPWGFYKTTVLNEYFQSKIISLKPGHQLSLLSHNRRKEHWILAHGTGTIQIERSVINVSCGSSLFIPMGAKLCLTNTDAVENLIITEVQIGGYLGEDDILRYEDIYGRN